jgi:hypothetical protein
VHGVADAARSETRVAREFFFAIDGTVVEESGGLNREPDLDVSWRPVVYYRRGMFLYKFSVVDFVGGEVSEILLGEASTAG